MAKRKNASTALVPAARKSSSLAAPEPLLDDVRNLIRQAREVTAQAANSALVFLYWQIGQRIRTEVLKARRAGYGEEICSTLSNELASEFGTGFSRPNLTRMIRFAEVFPEREIVATLSRQLSWSHFVAIIYLPVDLQRDFPLVLKRLFGNTPRETPVSRLTRQALMPVPNARGLAGRAFSNRNLGTRGYASSYSYRPVHQTRGTP
jgi:hypothetical protein